MAKKKTMQTVLKQWNGIKLEIQKAFKNNRLKVLGNLKATKKTSAKRLVPKKIAIKISRT